MKKVLGIVLYISLVLIIVGALFRALHWHGGREISIIGLCFLLVSTLLIPFVKKEKQTKGTEDEHQ
jgi:hypothetical protein